MTSPDLPTDDVVSEPTPEKFRSIASMLDLMDVILGKLSIGGVGGDDLVKAMRSLQGAGMQSDLRQWADTLGSLEDSGLRYCVTHHGLVETDADEPCDFFEPGVLDVQFDCVLRPLFYRKDPDS